MISSLVTKARYVRASSHDLHVLVRFLCFEVWTRTATRRSGRCATAECEWVNERPARADWERVSLPSEQDWFERQLVKQCQRPVSLHPTKKLFILFRSFSDTSGKKCFSVVEHTFFKKSGGNNVWNNMHGPRDRGVKDFIYIPEYLATWYTWFS